jgi:hypothetical protein
MVNFVSMVVTYSSKMIKTLALASNFLRPYFTVDPNMLECFSLEKPYKPSLMFVSKAGGAYPCGVWVNKYSTT